LSNTERRRVGIVERLAQKMYEASEPGNMLWLRRGWTVREIWLKKARERLEGAGKPVDRLYAWWNVWGTCVCRVLAKGNRPTGLETEQRRQARLPLVVGCPIDQAISNYGSAVYGCGGRYAIATKRAQRRGAQRQRGDRSSPYISRKKRATSILELCH
jgi:hypothetical protein